MPSTDMEMPMNVVVVAFRAAHFSSFPKENAFQNLEEHL